MSAKANAPTSRVGREFAFTRVFDAPRDLVFKAWTDSEHLAQWFGPHGYTISVFEADPSPGGTIRFDMREPDGTIYSVKGIYREIVESKKLVFTEAVSERGKLVFELLNTVTFTERNGKTTLKVTSRALKAPAAMAQFVDGMETGWIETLDRLETHLSKMSAGLEQSMGTPAPHPALKLLDRLVGRWDIKGRTPDSKEDNITGRMTCDWLPGGFFMQQNTELHFNGLEMQSLEIIRYDPSSHTFPASVYTNISGDVLPYHWKVQGDTVTHWTPTHKYSGTFSKDSKTLSGGWRPVKGNQGVAYDAIMTRLGQQSRRERSQEAERTIAASLLHAR
jgi:uncharacterized protein YndB with AHSA1/START domain